MEETVKEKQVKTDNGLFAKFLWWDTYSNNSFKCPNIYPIENNYGNGWTTFSADQLMFHTSWDWLMPCAQRFYKLYADSDHSKDWSWHYFEIKKSLANADINAAYNSLVNAIRWYNTQALPPPIKQ